MSSPVVVLEPVPAAGIKSCEPNLMPFHISYSGPALISTFMQVKPAKEEEIGTPAEQEQKDGVTEGPSTATQEDAAQIPTEVKKAAEDNTAMAMAVDAPPEGQANLNSTRTVSTFRGRIIQSLKVDLPGGYGGLVLRAPPPQTTTAPLPSKPSEPSTVASGSKAKSKATQEDAADDDEFPTALSTRRRGRLARSAVPTKVVDVDKEEEIEKKRAKPTEAIDVDAEPSPAMDVDATGLDTSSPQRCLKPLAEFSSFTIWHPDNPVVELQDEYYRSVHEWTALAAVLHQGDDEE